MAEMIHSGIVLESANKQIRYKLFVTEDANWRSFGSFITKMEVGSRKAATQKFRQSSTLKVTFYLNRDSFRRRRNTRTLRARRETARAQGHELDRRPMLPLCLIGVLTAETVRHLSLARQPANSQV
jgi:hypothetical protein